MITALDHIAVKVADVATSASAMERLLARSAIVGEETATIRLDNMALELSLSEGGTEGLAGLAFEIDNADVAFRACQNRALRPSPPFAFAETDAKGRLREGHHVDLDTGATFGVAVTLVEYARNTPPFQRSSVAAEGAVTGLDHVVVRTAQPDRAAALYGARLGLDMRLDRTEPKWGSRLMFFRCGDLIVEIVHDLKAAPSDEPDRLWGLSWRVADAGAANARLKAQGFDVSEVRSGRKPGTRVFTVRNNTLGVPTLCVEPARKT